MEWEAREGTLAVTWGKWRFHTVPVGWAADVEAEDLGWGWGGACPLQLRERSATVEAA